MDKIEQKNKSRQELAIEAQQFLLDVKSPEAIKLSESVLLKDEVDDEPELRAEILCSAATSYYMTEQLDKSLELFSQYLALESTLHVPAVVGGVVARQLAAHCALNLGMKQESKEHTEAQLELIMQNGCTAVLNMPDNFYGGRVKPKDRQVPAVVQL